MIEFFGRAFAIWVAATLVLFLWGIWRHNRKKPCAHPQHYREPITAAFNQCGGEGCMVYWCNKCKSTFTERC